jgi:putative nucleotidyltransferase with HDIG domain
MSIHVLADNSGKLAGIRAALEHKYDVTSELLGGVSISRGECTALVIKADLRIVENIAALRKTLGNLSRVRRRIFLFDQTVHWWIAQAYALGATLVLTGPANQAKLLSVLADRVGPGTSGTKDAGSKIADHIAENGLSNWLATVRCHHEGTYQHCLLVTGVAIDFGLNLGLAKRDMERLYSAAMFHDVGKATIPLAILDKPGRLDPQERATIETHPALGYHALKDNKNVCPEILDAVRHHHEYLDGSGYPDALCAENISDVVRILTISDIFSALIEDRRYKPPTSREEAYDILCGMQGKLEKPLVAAFKQVALNR